MAADSYSIKYNGQLGLYVIVSKSGELPEELTGRYTHQRLARRALNIYMEGLKNAAPSSNKPSSKQKRTGTSN